VVTSTVKKNQIELTPVEREQLEHLLAGGISKVRVVKRATGLLELNRGKTLEAVAATLGVCRATVARWRDNYQERGLLCLEDAPRSGRPIEIDGPQRAKITALACSQAPAGHARWSMRLLADKVVELGYCAAISHTEVAKILKKTNSSPTLRKRGAWAN
jgi:putative transposase